MSMNKRPTTPFAGVPEFGGAPYHRQSTRKGQHLMDPLPIAHFGVLVADVETARRRWSNALGASFSPIVRYRSAAWSDLADPTPHRNELRQTVYIGVNPSIEIQEFGTNSTHAASRGEGGHHVAFAPIADNSAIRHELAAFGIGMDGVSDYDGRSIIQFTEARLLNNVATEWIEASPGHLDLKDDGSSVDRLPDGSSTVFDAQTILALDGQRPRSGIVEFGVLVANLDKAVEKWSAVTGYAFDTAAKGERSAISRGIVPAVRLVEASRVPAREGLSFAVVETDGIEATRERLRRAGVPLVSEANAMHDHVDVDPAYLNGFSLRFVAGREQGR
jgi:hypothetical protein